MRGHRLNAGSALCETFYGRGYVLKDRIAMSDLTFRAQAVMLREVEVIKAQLRRN